MAMTKQEAIEKAVEAATACSSTSTYSLQLKQARALESLAWSQLAALLPSETTGVVSDLWCSTCNCYTLAGDSPNCEVHNR